MKRPFSVEMTFIPNRAPYCFKNYNETQAICNQINKNKYIIGNYLYAKVDPFYIYGKTLSGDKTVLDENEWTWCIEIVPINEKGFFDLSNILNESWSSVVMLVDYIIKLLKTDFNLVTHKETKTKNTIKHYSGGGSHIQYSINNIYNNTPDFLSNLAIFHKLLYIDFYTKPYISWLFRQWFDNNNATIAYPIHYFCESHYQVTNAIVARFQQSDKTPYSTYEFRFFDMIRNGNELYANINFIESWIRVLKEEAAAITEKQKNSLDFWETRAKIDFKTYESYQTIRGGRKAVKGFLNNIELSWDLFEERFERNYVNRVKYGKFL